MQSLHCKFYRLSAAVSILSHILHLYIYVVAFEVPCQVMETQVYVDKGSAATEHFITPYVSSKTYGLPAKEVSPRIPQVVQ